MEQALKKIPRKTGRRIYFMPDTFPVEFWECDHSHQWLIPLQFDCTLCGDCGATISKPRLGSILR